MSASASHWQLPPLPEPWRARLRALPPQPPSWLAALALQRLLLPRLDAEQRRALGGAVVELELQELGLRVRLRLQGDRFVAAGGQEPARLRLSARTDALWRLLRGQDDADRLFFERALQMEGDTEYGLVLKNTLDALGPLLPM
ncbi:MAG: SCP2 sterol-binding domain-containing protein [Inhella sp.]